MYSHEKISLKIKSYASQKDVKSKLAILYLFETRWTLHAFIHIFDSFENNVFLDPDQLVLQSQLPQNPDPEADPKIVFHCLP